MGVFAGTVAGAPRRDGYITFQVEGFTHQAHRLAWLYVRGEWPKQQIDHINGVRADNRIENLRDVSSRTNAQNLRRAHSKNKLGVMGVRKGVTPGRWEASIVVDGRRKWLGTFPTPEAAHAAYIEAKRTFHEGCTI